MLMTSLRALFARLDPVSRRRWSTLLPLGLLASAIEAGCTLGVVVVLRSLAGGGALGPAMPWLCLAGSLMYIVRGAVRLGETHLRHLTTSGSTRHLLGALLARYLAAPQLWHLERHQHELAHRLGPLVRDACQRQLYSLVGALVEGGTVLAILAILVWTSPGALLGAAALVGVVVAVVLRASQSRLRVLGARGHRTSQEQSRRLGELIASIKELKLAGLSQACARGVERCWAERAAVEVEAGVLAGVPRVALETLFIVGVLLVAGISSAAGMPAEQVLPVLGLYVYAGSRLLPSLSVLVFHLGELRFHAAAVGALLAEFDELDRIAAAAPAAREPDTLREAIVLEDVSFCYPSRGEPTLDGVSLAIPRGAWIGIAGASGAGKSTLVDLMLGLLPPTAGRVLVDGVAVSGLVLAPGRVAYVPQGAFVHESTLLENVAMGEATPDRARALCCLETVQLDDLPDGLDGRVGDRGFTLSSGQRQRLAIARALYRDPALLVLDEATAALDRPTEDRLLSAIAARHPGLTVVLISHRTAALARCDRVALLRAGRLEDVGRHDELLVRSALFADLARHPAAVA